MGTFLEVRGIRKSFIGSAALSDLSFQVGQGEIFSIVGPAGSGKTTSLLILAGSMTPDAGTIQLRGKSLLANKSDRRGIHLVPHRLPIPPEHTALRYLLDSQRSEKGKSHGLFVLETLGLLRIAERPARQLTGETMQMLAIARTLFWGPEVLLLDNAFEATGFLELRIVMKEFLRTIGTEFGATTILAMTKLESAIAISDHVGVLRSGRMSIHGFVGRTGEERFAPGGGSESQEMLNLGGKK